MSLLNVCKSGLTIGERRKLSAKILNRQRSMTTVIARRIISPKMFNRDRLVGGADVSEEPEPVPVSEVKEASAEAPPELIPEVSSSPSPLSPSLIPPTPPSSPVEEIARSEIRDKDPRDKQLPPASGPCCFCVTQTPGSVGDRKVDEIIEYVHLNLEEAGKALATLGENFEHDLKLMFVDILGRIKQWSGIVQNKLDVCKIEVNNIRKELLARVCEVDVKTREVADLKARITQAYEKAELEKQAEQRTTPLATVGPPTTPLTTEDVQAAIAKESQLPLTHHARPRHVQDSMRIDDRKDEKYPRYVQDEKMVQDEESVRDESVGRYPSRRDVKEGEDITYASATAQTVVQERDRLKRESELESEVTRLRKENDRIVKERAEYENAIQRALLRGVSSLNAEALRVLRCPPIPCCAPCAPCPATAIIPPEPVVPCPSKSARRRPGSAITTVCSTKVPYDRNARTDDQAYYTTKRPCTSPCCSANKSRRPADDSMIFLLRQGDAGNLCAPDENVTPAYGSPILKNLVIPSLPRYGT